MILKRYTRYFTFFCRIFINTTNVYKFNPIIWNRVSIKMKIPRLKLHHPRDLSNTVEIRLLVINLLHRVLSARSQLVSRLDDEKQLVNRGFIVPRDGFTLHVSRVSSFCSHRIHNYFHQLYPENSSTIIDAFFSPLSHNRDGWIVHNAQTNRIFVWYLERWRLKTSVLLFPKTLNSGWNAFCSIFAAFVYIAVLVLVSLHAYVNEIRKRTKCTCIDGYKNERKR